MLRDGVIMSRTYSRYIKGFHRGYSRKWRGNYSKTKNCQCWRCVPRKLKHKTKTTRKYNTIFRELYQFFYF